MAVEIITQSISTKVWDRAANELKTPRSAVRHCTDWATWPSSLSTFFFFHVQKMNHMASLFSVDNFFLIEIR